MKRFMLLLVLACLAGSACQSSERSSTVPPAASPSPNIATAAETRVVPRVVSTRHAIISPTDTFLPSTSTLTPTQPPTLSPTPSPYEAYTIEALRSRTYGGGNIEVLEGLEQTDSFTRYLIRYPSDGLNIYGFANLPQGEGPFPVIIVIHGFVKRDSYQTLDYSTPVADRLAQAGYLVIHPNLRGYPPSDEGDNLFRVGLAIDVLNLIALVKSETGQSALLANAAPDQIGLLGHSLGGNVALRVLTVSPDIKAAVLYAPISGDELKNAQLFSYISNDPIFQRELETSPSIVERISPTGYYRDITAPVQLHHGTADLTVPIAWAHETCDALTTAGVQTECIYYPEEDHTFRIRVQDQFWDAVLGFYGTHLSP